MTDSNDDSDVPIRLVDLKGGDLGRPEPGIGFDTRQAARGFAAVDRWSKALLKAKERCVESRDERTPVLAVEITGSGKETMVRSIDQQLPGGVKVYTPPFENGPFVFGLKNEDGTISRATVFYLFAP